MGEKPKTSFNVVREFVVRPKPGTRFGPNCIAIGTRVPVEKDGQVLGHAEVVKIKPDGIVLRGVENKADKDEA